MLNNMERLILDTLLAGDDDRLSILRAQLNSATVERRRDDRNGFFVDFSVPLGSVATAARLELNE